MKPEPRLYPLSVPILTVTTLGSTLCTTPASEFGGRCASGAVPEPPPPSTARPTPPRLAKTYPRVPPRAPASSAVTMAIRKTTPSPRRAGSAGTGGAGGGPPVRGPSDARITTADGAPGSRHGSLIASDHHHGE